MSEQDLEQDDDILELTEEAPTDADFDENGDEIMPPQPEQEEDDDGEVAIEVEGDDEPDEEPHLAKKLRAEVRERNKRIKELEARLAPKPVDIGKKPDLWEDCEGDPDKFEADLLAWTERKRQAEQAERSQTEQQTTQQQAFEKKNIAYRANAAKMGMRDIEKYEQSVIDSLGADYLGAIVRYADDPAKVVAGLGRNSHILDKIADESDPVIRLKLMFQLEKQMVIKRKGAAAPEAGTILKGTANVSGGDKALEKLEKDAERTGDRSKLIAYKANKGKK